MEEFADYPDADHSGAWDVKSEYRDIADAYEKSEREYAETGEESAAKRYVIAMLLLVYAGKKWGWSGACAIAMDKLRRKSLSREIVQIITVLEEVKLQVLEIEGGFPRKSKERMAIEKRWYEIVDALILSPEINDNIWIDPQIANFFDAPLIRRVYQTR